LGCDSSVVLERMICFFLQMLVSVGEPACVVLALSLDSGLGGVFFAVDQRDCQ
jgi:hypothetical protein